MGAGGELVAQGSEGFTIKNTFIEFDNDGLFEDDGWDNPLTVVKKRQVSEPAFAFSRQVSRPPLVPLTEEGPEFQCHQWGLLHDAMLADEPQTASQRWATGPYAGAEDSTMALGAPWLYDNQWHQACHSPGAFAVEDLAGAPPSAQEGRRQSPGAFAVEKFAGRPLSAQEADNGPGGSHTKSGNNLSSLVPGTSPALPAKAVTGSPISPDWAETLTVMMRNLPNRYTQQMLLNEIREGGFLGAFDFLYLPIDPETNANKGYAFINFLTPADAWQFKLKYEGQQMARFNSSKFVSVSPAALQGLEANYAHYSTARCSRGDPSVRPLFFREPQHSALLHSGAGQRRGGQRRRTCGRSLVDVALQQKLEQQLRPPQQQYAQAQAAETALPKFCPYCGGATQPTHRFCQYCGASQANLGQ